MQQTFLLQILLLAQYVSGQHYSHHQGLKSIIQCLLPVVFRAVVFKLLVWCGAEGYVSSLKDAAASCKPLYDALELLMMGIVVPQNMLIKQLDLQ